jgi:hypothetical protein
MISICRRDKFVSVSRYICVYSPGLENDRVKEFIIKMEGNTGEFLDISGSEIHGGRCVQSLPGFLSED